MEKPPKSERLVESLFALVLAAVFAGAVAIAREWRTAAIFPMLIAIPGFLLAAALSLKIALRGDDNSVDSHIPPGARIDIYLDQALLRGTALMRTIIIFAWIFGMFIGGWLLGQRIALPLFVFLYLKVGAKEGWMLSIGLTLAVAAFLLGVFDQVIHVSWYEGELFRWLGMEPF